MRSTTYSIVIGVGLIAVVIDPRNSFVAARLITPLGSLTNAHLIAYLENDQLANAANAAVGGEVPMAVKTKALHQAGLSPLEVGVLLTLTDIFKRSLGSRGSTDKVLLS